MTLDNYCLDLKKVLVLSANEREIVISMYKDMIYSFYENGKEKMFKSFFYTLHVAGFIVDLRSNKIDSITETVENESN
jgi:hypothetical protein